MIETHINKKLNIPKPSLNSNNCTPDQLKCFFLCFISINRIFPFSTNSSISLSKISQTHKQSLKSHKINPKSRSIQHNRHQFWICPKKWWICNHFHGSKSKKNNARLTSPSKNSNPQTPVLLNLPSNKWPESK